MSYRRSIRWALAVAGDAVFTLWPFIFIAVLAGLGYWWCLLLADHARGVAEELASDRAREVVTDFNQIVESLGPANRSDNNPPSVSQQ